MSVSRQVMPLRGAEKDEQAELPCVSGASKTRTFLADDWQAAEVDHVLRYAQAPFTILGSAFSVSWVFPTKKGSSSLRHRRT